jgi:protein SCO1
VVSIPQFNLIKRGLGDGALMLILLVAGLVLGLALYWFGRPPVSSISQTATQANNAMAPNQFETLLLYPKPKVLPHFSLAEYVDGQSQGQALAFGPEALKGRWHLLFFGFTTCPDICPTTLTELKTLRRDLGPLAPELVFVSVDPERDSAEVLRGYVNFFDSNTRTVTSDVQSLTQFAASVGAVFAKVPNEDGQSYTMDHSSSLVLINPQGELAGLMRPPFKLPQMAADLRSYFELIGVKQ